VVDDDARANATICQLLATLGIVPQGFTGVLPFLAGAKAEPPDVVVLDLALGESDAVEVIRQLDIVGFAGKVLLISGRDEATLGEIRQVGLAHGLAMLPTLRKPFRAADLQRAFFAPPESREASHRRTLDHNWAAGWEVRIDLEQALQEGWLELWYQPKIDLKSLRICGAEALLRARHPEFGIALPAQLLPAQGSPLYFPLSEFVVGRVLTDWSRFADAGLPLKLAVNLSLAVIQAPDFVGLVRSLLPEDERFPGLIFEIAEDDIVRDPLQAREVASQLKLYAIALSIEDFGAAHSSLGRLIELPSAELKIGRSFVSGCAGDRYKRVMCETVVKLAHRFGVAACAAGVERIEDLRYLISLGCDTAQGYFFAKPMERDVFIARVIAKAGAPAGQRRA
jgi:EAL domain-containing protein (putative c-di-GMP-specific phosphodiesterase class I)/ActR/RegA family two-component response regulator